MCINSRQASLISSLGMCRCAVMDVHFYCSVSEEQSRPFKTWETASAIGGKQQNSAVFVDALNRFLQPRLKQTLFFLHDPNAS